MRLFVHGGVYFRPTHIHNFSPPTNVFLTTTGTPMSSGEPETDPAISNFASILEAAAKEYEKLTKKDLRPFAAQFDKCDSPRAVLDIFRDQAQAFEEYRKSDDALMKWLDPTVNVLFTLSTTLGEVLALVVSLEQFTPYVARLPDAYFSAILSRKNDFCRHRSPPHRRTLPMFVAVHMCNVNVFRRRKMSRATTRS